MKNNCGGKAPSKEIGTTVGAGDRIRETVEAYRRIGDPDDHFDISFWQRQGDQAIFEAALALVLNAQIVREGHADEPRFQRMIEHFARL